MPCDAQTVTDFNDYLDGQIADKEAGKLEKQNENNTLAQRVAELDFAIGIIDGSSLSDADKDALKAPMLDRKEALVQTQANLLPQIDCFTSRIADLDAVKTEFNGLQTP